VIDLHLHRAPHAQVVVPLPFATPPTLPTVRYLDDFTLPTFYVTALFCLRSLLVPGACGVDYVVFYAFSLRIRWNYVALHVCGVVAFHLPLRCCHSIRFVPFALEWRSLRYIPIGDCYAHFYTFPRCRCDQFLHGLPHVRFRLRSRCTLGDCYIALHVPMFVTIDAFAVIAMPVITLPICRCVVRCVTLLLPPAAALPFRLPAAHAALRCVCVWISICSLPYVVTLPLGHACPHVALPRLRVERYRCVTLRCRYFAVALLRSFSVFTFCYVAFTCRSALHALRAFPTFTFVVHATPGAFVWVRYVR